jgi:hypothetical protein
VGPARAGPIGTDLALGNDGRWSLAFAVSDAAGHAHRDESRD